MCERPTRQQLVDPSCARSVAQLLATLPSEQREVLVLRVPLRLTVEDTAKIVGTSPTTVQLIQHRALNRLRPAQQVQHRPGLVIGAARPRAPEGLLADDRTGGLVVDVEVARGEPQHL